MTLGVSIVICTHNGRSRLPATLDHIARQSGCEFPWELLVIDNGSTDGTGELVTQFWRSVDSCPMRLIRENRLGLTYARQTGFGAASYELVLFVDDDNWLQSDYLRIAQKMFTTTPNLGACGGYARAVINGKPPDWFWAQQYCYAVGVQGPAAGDVSSGQGYLWGAGLCVRKAAVDSLVAAGFEQALTDRKGGTLLSGGDVELCFALRLAGWTLWYEPTLILHHFQPDDRLRWSYIAKQQRAAGRAFPVLGLYSLYFDDCPLHNRVIGANWTGRAAIAAANIIRFAFLYAMSGFAKHRQLELLRRYGVFEGLLENRSQYRNIHARIAAMTKRLRMSQPEGGTPALL